MSGVWDMYVTQFKASLASTVQYRTATLFWLVGMMVEPIIYLVVWTTVARSQGGIVGGYTAGEFAGYYIIWTLVRQMNIALTPYEFENRVLKGGLSPSLLRPVHPFHYDLSWFLGMKVTEFTVWLPIGILLAVIFKPTLNPAGWQIALFPLALLLGFLLRFVLLWDLGMITFWITRVSALFELYFALELLLSGRLVPLSLLPAWAQRIADYLPYRWAFAFQIELLLGRLDARQTLIGFAMQLLWIAIGALGLQLLWRAGIKRYSAVGA